jgi:hypothetical protein
MRMGRSQLSIVIDMQALVTHADNVASMEREMGNPPWIIRTPDVCYLFQARDEERLQGLVDRWESYGIAAQVVLIPAMEGHHPAKGGEAVTPEHLKRGRSAKSVHAWRRQYEERASCARPLTTSTMDAVRRRK